MATASGRPKGWFRILQTTSGVAPGGVVGGVDETRSLEGHTNAPRPDGAQPHRSNERVPRGRATPPTTPPGATPASEQESYEGPMRPTKGSLSAGGKTSKPKLSVSRLTS